MCFIHSSFNLISNINSSVSDKKFTVIDQVTINSEINKLRSELKVKVNDLRDLEFEDPVPGLNLKPMTREEMSAINQVLGYHAD